MPLVPRARARIGLETLYDKGTTGFQGIQSLFSQANNVLTFQDARDFSFAVTAKSVIGRRNPEHERIALTCQRYFFACFLWRVDYGHLRVAAPRGGS